MLNFLLSAAVGLICGVLSGFGVGGGTLLMVFLSTVAGMTQLQAQGVNLLYFLTARKGADCFYIINFACPESTQDTYVPLFALWQLYIEAE